MMRFGNSLLPNYHGHNLFLIEKFKDKKIRKLYVEKTIENGWSRNVLAFQIDTKYHLRIGNSSNDFDNTIPSIDTDLVNNIIKDPYIFDFISLKENFKEKKLETAMVNRIRDVLLELGNGFSFIGNQYKITLRDNDYYIDLLFYHLKLRCYILIELKATCFIPEYVGKLKFYLSIVDDVIKNENDNPSIGLILCKDKDKITAQYALKDIGNPIGVSSYEVNNLIPTEILDKLTTEEDINMYVDIK